MNLPNTIEYLKRKIKKIPTKVSELENDAGYITDAGAGSNVDADNVYFDDGQNFQQKYDNGELTGPAGKDGITPKMMIDINGHLIAIYDDGGTSE